MWRISLNKKTYKIRLKCFNFIIIMEGNICFENREKRLVILNTYEQA